ncbi:hypothetical protein [Xenorhabdus eapokensis]|uniref:hypothetical protein n=1 Tax=Xenorhabdus eapokensis TaxID=1873482 RepID=UPI00093967F7|nr:hypothetical protein [Xenorhabdus eapokensis]
MNKMHKLVRKGNSDVFIIIFGLAKSSGISVIIAGRNKDGYFKSEGMHDKVIKIFRILTMYTTKTAKKDSW